MALTKEVPRSFRLYVTHVDGEGPFLKISGQLDQASSLMVESLFESARESLEKGIGTVPPAAIQEGVVCAAKYKDGKFYRAKIVNTTKLTTGFVGVHFIDYGNKDSISLSAIRFLNNYDPMFLQLSGQASDYYLSRVFLPTGTWDEKAVLMLQSMICYAEYPATVDVHSPTLPIISIQFKGNDLSTHVISNRIGASISITRMEVLLQKYVESHQTSNRQLTFLNEPQFTEHVPFFINQNFPNPASAMRLNQNMPLPFNGNIPVHSPISHRLLVNRVSRNPVNLRAPVRQPQNVLGPSNSSSSTPPSTPIVSVKPVSPKKLITYKSKLLEVNSQYKVFVSYAEEGPELFAVQLVSDANNLQEMMDNINKRPHSSLTEPPMIGTVCLGRMSGDRIICRAIVMNLSGSQCKLFFVDFGDTEMVSYYDIFDIPEEFVKPNVFAMRFCLSGVKKLQKGSYVNETFKHLVSGKVLTLRVVTPEGPPLIQYGELFLDNKNVLDLLLANMQDKIQFKYMEMLPMGIRKSVLVSYVDSCIKFFVQLSDQIDELNAVMEAVKVHCENTSSPGELPVGAVCCARFPDDDNWYRARIRDIKGNKVVVVYIDYGNEQEVDIADLRTITPELIRLPAQALKCALKGFESKPVETKTSNQLEMLALEKTLMAQIVGVLSNDTMLVILIDDTVTPPLDVAKRMNQLSQPRSIEGKVTTPVRKEASESFSSPEGSVPDDNRKKSFRREKSFKDERKTPRENSDDFGQRGGSFRGRDHKEGFDRSGPGRHSEKFGGKPDRGDRRGGGKPWENNTARMPASTPSDDNWEETPVSASPSFQSPPPKHNNKDHQRRKPRLEHDKTGGKPGWKGKESSGVGKRLRQAAEAASLDVQAPRTTSVQDRLRRDNKFSQDERAEKDDWGSKPRDHRRDNRGDRRDNWGDKKENWNQKREFRDNQRPERGERNRSNFTPRERADRSERYGSDSDKRSDKSFRSQDSGDRAGRAPPYKSRSKFTQVQYKELADPVPLETAFTEPTIEVGAQHEVSMTWIISPENFYIQILSYQTKFLEMMHSIPDLYKGVKSYTGIVPVGASVLARYPVDGVLYRATVVSVQPFSKFIVRYVDFGNKQLVDAKDIWQLDRHLLELPKLAVHCSLIGVMPKDGEWKADPEIDLCFNAPRYQAIFHDYVNGQYKLSLWNNGVSIADMLVDKQLATRSAQQSSVTLKDEAIDLSIIIGQQIVCRVTHVESFEKFYIQLDLDKAALVESAIANIDASKLLAMDGVAEGIHCTVKHEGKIYRAILDDVSDISNIKASLPDYGKSITTCLENLMILPTELSVYYYQSLECCLNNYTAESKTLLSLDELKSLLTNNKFIIYINNVEDIKLVTTLYDRISGRKVAIFEPDEGAYDEVIQLCTRAVFNYNFGLAYLSHLENLNEFYLQKSSDGNKIAQLLEDLYKFYEEGTPQDLTEYEADALCAAKSADGNWYRATILSAKENEVKVQFTDYGNTESLTVASIKKLDSQFFEPCSMSLVASLGLVALHDDALTKLKEWTNDKEMQVTLAFGNDGWLANLHLDGVDLSMKLVSEKLATPQIITNEESKMESAPEVSISLPDGCIQVYISHIDTPGHFWLQMLDKVDKIEEIQTELQANADKYADVESREMNTLCIAKYLADDQWYRAEILDADSDITTVRFIDYGNTDVLDNQPGLIKEMPEHMKQIERYAVKSSINAIPTGTGQWSEAASDYFTQLVGDISAPVDVLIVLKDIMTYVDIFVNGQNLTDKLVSEGHATRSEDTECGDFPSCFASHINSPSEFWIQLETATTELQAMEAAMVDAENFPGLDAKEEGVICAAKYPEDGAWYRAQVIVDGSEGTEVLFMDYGNASIANELRSLPDELKIKPALSRKCALQKPRDIKNWSRKSEIKFNELAAEGATIFNVQFIAAGDISIVELYLDGKSITENLIDLCEEQPITERLTPVGQNAYACGKICFVNSLDEFYIHLDDCLFTLDEITKELYNCSEFETISELKVGSICAAFWTEDEKWYRAKILEFGDGGFNVKFIDYGNVAKCEDFRQLPEHLALKEPLAQCCRLAGLSDIDFSKESAKVKLDELASDSSVTFQIEYLDTLKEPILVKLLLDGKDVCSVITKENDSKESVMGDDVTNIITSESQVIVTNENKIKDNIHSSQDQGKENSLGTAPNSKNATINKILDDNELNKESLDKICEDKESSHTAMKNDCSEILPKDKVVNGKHLDVSSDRNHNEIENKSSEIGNDNYENIEDENKQEKDLTISSDSNNSVIENKSSKMESDYCEITKDETERGKSSPTSKINLQTETLQNSDDKLKIPEREESRDSVNTDTSGGDHDVSPKDSLSPSEKDEITKSVSDSTEMTDEKIRK